MSRRRRGFAAINVEARKDDHDQDSEKIEALESRLVKQYDTALQLIKSGDQDGARTVLQQLLHEPLLLQQAAAAGEVPTFCRAVGATSGSAAAMSSAAASQSRAVQGMRYKVLYNLAPLLGATPAAVAVWCAALAHSPHNPKIWEEASIIIAHLGHLQLAVYAANTAVSLSPDSVLLLERLVILLAAMSDWDAAGHMLLQLVRVTCGVHSWVRGLAQVKQKLTGFTEQDIRACIPDLDLHTQHVKQQQNQLASRMELHHPQEQTLQEFLGVSNSVGELHDGMLLNQHQVLERERVAVEELRRARARAQLETSSSSCRCRSMGSLVVNVSSIQQLLEQLVQLLARQYVILENSHKTDSSTGIANRAVAASAQAAPAVPGQTVQRNISNTAVAAAASGAMPGSTSGDTSSVTIERNIPPLRMLRVVLQQQSVEPATAVLPATTAGAAGHAVAAAVRGASGPVAAAASGEAAKAQHALNIPAPLVSASLAAGALQQHDGHPAALAPVNNEAAQVANAAGPEVDMVIGDVNTHAPCSKCVPILQQEQRQLGETPEKQQATVTCDNITHVGVNAAAAASGKLQTASKAPPPAAAAGRSRALGKHPRASHAKQLHVIQPLQLVHATVGKWLPAAVNINAREAQKGSTVTGAVLPQQPHQHSLQQQGAVSAVHTAAVNMHPASAEASSLQPQSWQQLEQQLLQQVSQQAPMLPLQLTQHLLSQLLTAAETTQIPMDISGLLLQLSSHIPNRQLTQQQHLVLAELHLDAVLAIKQTGAVPAYLGSSAAVFQATAAAGVASGHAAAGCVAVSDANVRPAASGKKRPLPSSGDGGGGGAAAAGGDAAVGQTTAPAIVTLDVHDTEGDAGSGAAPKRARICRPPTRQRQQQPAAAGNGDGSNATPATGAASGGPGSRIAVKQQAEARKRLHDEHVQQHMKLCEQHLQQHVIAGTCSSMPRPAPQPPLVVQLPVAWDGSCISSDQADRGMESVSCSEWDPTQPDSLWGLTLLQSCWWKQIHRAAQQAMEQQEHATPQQQQQHGHEPAKQQPEPWWLQAAFALSSSSVPQATADAGTGRSRKHTGLCRPSMTTWANMLGFPHQAHQPLQPCVAHGSVYRAEWGPAIRPPGLAMYNSSMLAAAASTGTGLQDTALQQDCTSVHKISKLWERPEHWLQRPLADEAGMAQQGQQGQRMPGNGSAAAQVTLGDLVVVDAQPTPTAADCDAAQVRRCWVAARLYQAQDNLEAAAAAGKKCFAWFEQQQSAVQAADATAAAAAPTSAAAGVEGHPGQLRLAQPEAASVVQLPSCQYDAVISKPAVQRMLDCMWLTMQVTTVVQQQLPEIDELLKELQHKLGVTQQQQPMQHRHPLPLQRQPEQGGLWPSEQQQQQEACAHVQAMQEESVQLAEQVQRIAEQAVEALQQRCLLVVPGELSPQQLSALSAIHKAVTKAAAAATTALTVLQMPHASPGSISDCDMESIAAASVTNQQLQLWQRQQQAAQQRYRRLELQCILLQLQHWLRLHCQHARPTAATKAASGNELAGVACSMDALQGRSAAAAAASGNSTPYRHGSSTNKVDNELKVRLQEFSIFWRTLVKPVMPNKVARVALAAEGAAVAVGAAKHQGQPQLCTGVNATGGVANAAVVCDPVRTAVTGVASAAAADSAAAHKAAATAADSGMEMADADSFHEPEQQQQSQKSPASDDAEAPAAAEEQHNLDAAAAAAQDAAAAEAEAVQKEQQRKQEEAAELQDTAAALAAAKAAEQVQQAEKLMLQDLEQHPEVVGLLRHVQQLLLELMAAHSPALPVPKVAAVAPPPPPQPAAAAAHLGAGIAEHAATASAAGDGIVAAASPDANGASAPAPSRTRISKRKRVPTATAVSAVADAAEKGAAPTMAAAATRRAAAAGSHSAVQRKDLSSRSTKDKTLFLEAAVGVLAAHELDPEVSGDASSVLGLVEGLYSMLSLKFTTAAEVEKFMQLAWDRLLLVFWKLEQQQQGQWQQQLAAVDKRLGRLLLDLHGFDVSWGHRNFGMAPVAQAIAAEAAAAAAATAGDAGRHISNDAVQPDAPAADAAAPFALPTAAAVAEAAVTAAHNALASRMLGPRSSYQLHHHHADQQQFHPQQHDAAAEEVDLAGVFRPRVVASESGHDCNLTDLLRIWRYVSVAAGPTEILRNPRANGMYAEAAACESSSRELMAIAERAAAAVLTAVASSSVAGGVSAQTGISNASHMQLANACLNVPHPNSMARGAAAAAGATAHQPFTTAELQHGDSGSGSSDGDDSSSNDESDSDEEELHPTTALGMESKFWNRQMPLLEVLLRRLPKPPVELLHAACSRVDTVLDGPVDAIADKSGTLAGSAADVDPAGDAVMRHIHDTNGSAVASTAGSVAAAGGVYGWGEADLQLILAQEPLVQNAAVVEATQAVQAVQQLYIPGPPAGELASADPLLELHSLLYHAVAFKQPRLLSTADGHASDNTEDKLPVQLDGSGDGLSRMQEQEQHLLHDLAVRPDAAVTWQQLAELYLYVEKALLEQAASIAPVAAWRAAAQNAASVPADPEGARLSSPTGSSSTSRRTQVQLLRRYSRRALRATVIAAELMKHQRRDNEDWQSIALCLNSLGGLLRDAAMCLAPWYEPWRFKPENTGFRTQLLQAAQACLQQAQQPRAAAATGWTQLMVLAQIASKQQQPGWQAYCLQQYARACYLSRSEDECGAACLQPYVKLHGLRLKLLTAAVGRSIGGPHSPPASVTGNGTSTGGAAADKPGRLCDLLDLLQLLSRWCFSRDADQVLQPLLQQLQQQLAQQQVPADMQQLRLSFSDWAEGDQRQCLQEHLHCWLNAVELLLEDACNGLTYCQDCYSKSLGPARYSLAKAMYRLNRFEAAAEHLATLFNMSGPISSRKDACPLSTDLLTATGHIKAAHQPNKQLHKQQQRLQDSARLHAQQLLQSSKGGNVLAGNDDVDMADADSAAVLASVAADDSFSAAAAAAAAEERFWGSAPPCVRGWGEDENERQWNTRTRKALLLYLKVISLKQDMAALAHARQGLMGTVGLSLTSEGFSPKDLGDLAAGLQLRLVLLQLGPVLQSYAAAWEQQKQEEVPSAAAATADGEAAAAALVTATQIGVMPEAAAAAPAACASTDAFDERATSPAAQTVAAHAPVPAAAPSSSATPPPQQTTGGMSLFKLKAPKQLVSEESRAGQQHQQLNLFLSHLTDFQQQQRHSSQVLQQSDSLEQQQHTERSRSQPSSTAGSMQLGQLLEDAFQFYLDYLFVATVESWELKLGELLSAAEEFEQHDTAAATTATATVDAGAAAGARLQWARDSNGNFSNKQIEWLLQFLAHAHVALIAQHTGASTAEHVSSSPAATAAAVTAIARLREVSKQLRDKFKKAQNLRMFPVGMQKYVAMVLFLCKAVAQHMLDAAHTIVSGAEAAVNDQLGQGQQPELQPLQSVVQQQQTQEDTHSTVVVAPAAAAAAGTSPPPGAAADPATVQGDTEATAADVSVDSRAASPGAEDMEHAAAAAPSSRATTPLPPTPGEAAAAVLADTPPGAAAAQEQVTPTGQTAAAGTGAPAATPVHATPAEGRRARRAAAVASLEHVAQALGTAGNTAATQSKHAVVFDNVQRTAAVTALLPLLKSTNDLIKANIGTYLLESVEARVYAKQLYRLAWQLVELGARSAGLPVTAVTGGTTSQPTTEKGVVAALQSSYVCLADLMKGRATEAVVQESQAAVKRAEAEDQREQQQQQQQQHQQHEQHSPGGIAPALKAQLQRLPPLLSQYAMQLQPHFLVAVLGWTASEHKLLEQYMHQVPPAHRLQTLQHACNGLFSTRVQQQHLAQQQLQQQQQLSQSTAVQLHLPTTQSLLSRLCRQLPGDLQQKLRGFPRCTQVLVEQELATAQPDQQLALLHLRLQGKQQQLRGAPANGAAFPQQPQLPPAVPGQQQQQSVQSVQSVQPVLACVQFPQPPRAQQQAATAMTEPGQLQLQERSQQAIVQSRSPQAWLQQSRAALEQQQQQLVSQHQVQGTSRQQQQHQVQPPARLVILDLSGPNNLEAAAPGRAVGTQSHDVLVAAAAAASAVSQSVSEAAAAAVAVGGETSGPGSGGSYHVVGAGPTALLPGGVARASNNIQVLTKVSTNGN